MIIIIKLIVLGVFAYLLGSIPAAYIATKLNKGIDIRREGTGNVGATNTLLVVGPMIGVFVCIFDILKGFIPVIIARNIIGTDFAMCLIGFAVILGHDFSIFLRFSGGKGIATTTGVLFAMNMHMTLYLIFGWAILVILTNYFIVASLLATALVPVGMYFLKSSSIYILFGIACFFLALYTHRQDTVRIIWGQEKKAFDSVKKFFRKERII